ncbi:plasmid transfer protein TraA [Streptomyces filamentosus]|uniref:plasmid transfer protein TraA n=1 Tax=Streptomyces filamentosus TaxID=67294 RepID=UPI0037D0F26B
MAAKNGSVPPQTPGSGTNGSRNEAKSGAKFGPSFSVNPSVTLTGGSKTRNTTVNSHSGGGSGRSSGGPGHLQLPDPDFSTPAGIRAYCNQLRTVSFLLATEVAVGVEILKGTLGQVPAPHGSGITGGSKARAWKVGRQLQKSADAMAEAARAAAATYAKFQQEYEEELNRNRHRARPQVRRVDWTQQ